jgi:AcrR family transcriptional regulator
MPTHTKDTWIHHGYSMFANEGPSGLKVERLAKLVNKSKSSFYHLFVDTELFVEHLLKAHLDKSDVIAQKEKAARVIDPQLIKILVDHRTDLLFNRQLRIHKNIKAYEETLCASSKIIGDPFKGLWLAYLNPLFSQTQIESFFDLAIENFYLQINAETLTQEWLTAYFRQLQQTAQKFM